MSIATSEQQQVNHSNARVKLVEAYAGTGKSWLLHQEALLHSRDKILYLVYGRKAKEDAERLFSDCRHVHVRTIHGHAYACEQGQWEASQYALSSLQLLNYYRKPHCKHRQHDLAYITVEFLTYYLNTTEKDLLASYTNYLPYIEHSSRYETYVQYKYDILESSKLLLNKWLSQDIECPHDFYLKYSHISQSFQEGLAKYDRLLVDEAQDMSPIMSSALDSYDGHLIYAGDSYQSIYGFRYVQNVLKTCHPDESFILSKSFRFGNVIANFVTEYMLALVSEKYHLSGNTEVSSRIDTGSIVYNSDIQSAVIARTNSGLIQTAVDLLSQNIPFTFERDVSYIFNKLEDIWNLLLGNRVNIQDPFIKTFKVYAKFKSYIYRVEDIILISLSYIVDKYYQQMPQLIHQLREQSFRGEGIKLITVHSSKGKEYDTVYIHDDVFRSLEREVISKHHNEEEYRIMYVALTRAKKNIIFPEEHRQVILGWKNWLVGLGRTHRISFWES